MVKYKKNVLFYTLRYMYYAKLNFCIIQKKSILTIPNKTMGVVHIHYHLL